MYVGVVFLGGVGVTAEARGVVVFDANYHKGFGVVDASDVFLCRLYLAFLPREAVRDIDRLDGTVEGLEEVGAFDAAAVQQTFHTVGCVGAVIKQTDHRHGYTVRGSW